MVNPNPASSTRSCGVNNGPRIPRCAQRSLARSPSSCARRNGVPWVYGAPKYVSQVSRCVRVQSVGSEVTGVEEGGTRAGVFLLRRAHRRGGGGGVVPPPQTNG